MTLFRLPSQSRFRTRYTTSLLVFFLALNVVVAVASLYDSATLLGLSGLFSACSALLIYLEWKRKNRERDETQAKLIMAHRMASLGMLVSGMAHEINNPNQYISTNALILKEIWADASEHLARYRELEGEFTLKGLSLDQAQQTVPRLLSGLSEGARRIDHIVNNLREYGRRDHEEPAPCRLNDCVRSAVQILTHEIHRSTDAFHLELDHDLPAVRGRAQQLEQVAVNLITNALQALTDRGEEVRVTTRTDRDAGILLTVTDKGRGMDKKLLARAAEPFFSTRLDQGGAGLGLSIAATIVKEHQGRLAFHSAPGAGTTVTVRLNAVAG